MSNIFISYSSEDRDWARRLAQALELEGWSVWWDKNIATGKPFQRVIEEQLNAADCVIVIWSEHSIASTWVEAEASEGLRRNLLVPVSIDDTTPPLVFRQIQTADFGQWDGSPSAPVFRRLADDIRPLIAETKKSETPVSPPLSQEPVPPPQPAPKETNHFKWYAMAAAILLAIGLFVAWPYFKPLFIPGQPPIPSAQVIHFTADPPQIEAGGSATLSWETKNAMTVTLSTEEDERGQSIAPAGTKIVHPQGTTVFFLKAHGTDPEKKVDVARQTVTVAPTAIKPDPQVVVFEADRKVLIRGDSTALHWETAHASRIELNDAIVNPSGDIEIRPDQTTTYRLIAVNESGKSDSKSITLTVEDLPREEIAEIQELLGTLGYDVGLADGVPGQRTRAAIEAFQNKTGLSATGLPSRYLAEKLRDVHRSIPAPEIIVFKSDRQRIGSKDKTAIHWRTTGAERVELIPFGKVGLSGSKTVWPDKATTYELVATNAAGARNNRSITIEIAELPEIRAFLADSKSVKQGGYVTLSWAAVNAARVELTDAGTVEIRGQRRIRVDHSREFKLTATNDFGESVSKTLTVQVACLPNIDKFWADSDRIKNGGATYLRWNTSCADRVTISAFKQNMNLDGSMKVSPRKTVTYTLTAWGSDKQSTRQNVTITVDSATVSGGTVILAGGGKYLDDKRVLSAIFYGVPLKGIAAKRIGKVQTFFEFPLGKNKIDAAKYNYDVTRSKRFMAEAGLVKGIGAYMFFTEDLSNLAQDVQNYFKRFGIQVRLKAFSSATARRAAESQILKTGRPTFLLELRK